MKPFEELSDQGENNANKDKPKSEKMPNTENQKIEWPKISIKLGESDKKNVKSKKNTKKLEQSNFLENQYKLRSELRTVYALTSPMQPSLQMNKHKDSFDEFKLDGFEEEIKSNKKSDNFQAFVIGICGGANSGKTFIAEEMEKDMSKLGIGVVVLKEKNFFKKLDQNFETEEERQNFISKYDFDSPEAVDWILFEKALDAQIHKKPFNSPIYDLFSEKRQTLTQKMVPKDQIIIEGRLFYYFENFRKKIDFKLFQHTDNDLIQSRRVYKNLARGKPLEQVISKYNNYVKPAYERYVEPCKRYADIVIPNFGGTTFDEKTQSKATFPVLQMLNDLVEMRIKNIHQYKRKISDCSYIGDLEDTNNDLARKMSMNKSKH